MQEGLTDKDAARLLKEVGYNELPSQDGRSALAIIKGVLGEPMFGLLLAAAAVYLLIGDLKEAVLLSLFATMSVTIAVVQEFRSEKILQALRDLTSPRALVIRDGLKRRIPGREVVPGDVVILAEGDRVPADAVLLADDQIVTDESLLTGESVPVRKQFHAGKDIPAAKPGGDGSPHVFAGSLVVQGSGRVLVEATGVKSAIGRIGRALAGIQMEPPRLQQQTKKVVVFFAAIGMSLCLAVVAIYGFLKGDWTAALLQGIALGMTLLPEEFPLTLTVFMVMGAWRISKARVLTRRAASIETLGSATVLCTDKTGTLTQNKMSIVFLQAGGEVWQAGGMAGQALSEPLSALVRAGRKSCKEDSHDPMDLAFSVFPLPEGREQDARMRHYSLKSGSPIMAQAYSAGEKYRVFAKGAPEAIAAACHLSPEQTERLHDDVRALAAEGMRVLAVAEAGFSGAVLPESAGAFDYRYLGLVGFADPIREAVPVAVAECRSAGIRVVMITGDYPATARAIALQAGIAVDKVLSGDEIAAMTDAVFADAVAEVNVFARIVPEQKLRIVEALKKNGEIVAMTGDGVNDAPSLKAAHIGVAMGGRGTDVAREASSIVLLDDNFDALVSTIALGRRIYDNLRKAMTYIISIHVPIAGLALWPVLLDMPLILTPLLIALLEMVIDPACSVVLEAEEAEGDVMRRKPRDPRSPLLSRPVLLWGVIQGAVSLIMVMIVLAFATWKDVPEDALRSLVFMLLLFCNLALILANRSFSTSLLAAFRRRNPLLGWGLLGIAVMFGGILLFPPFAETFRLGALQWSGLAVAAGGGFIVLLILEALKPLWGSRLKA